MGQAEILIDVACESELASVLAYRLRKDLLTQSQQAARLAECRRVACMLGAVPVPAHVLPACRDPDDQKFLELALSGRADFLVTKDLMLLELARRNVKRTPFRIVTPVQLNAALSAEAT